ncbi:MAG TPA: signal peptide peptidase SppA [Bacteroidales bacterium]|nr:signal peptide peptidase SppA [Bacteroidales bacterium]
MKQFLKFTLASMLGVFIALVLIFLILMGIVGAVSSSEKSITIKENSVLHLNLEGVIQEQSLNNPFDFTIPGLPVDTKIGNQGLDDLLTAIKKAKNNDNIKGIYITASTLQTGMATAEEIRNALLDFKKSGKFIFAYGELMDQKEYYIVSVANKIMFNPEGMLNFHGLAATPVFFKGTLEKIGVKPEIFRVGTFKSAVEPFICTEMSEANRKQTQETLNGIWNNMLGNISVSRKIDKDNLNQLANQNMLFEATSDLVKSKLIDSMLYQPDMMKYLSAKVGITDVDDLQLLSVKDLLTAPDETSHFEKAKVAVLYADGEIFDKGSEGVVSKDIIEEILKIQKDTMIKAVVFRVNSLGGSAYASEQIWKAMTDLKAKKPVVVSMGDYAASGGYYISCNANKIVATPNTITGSIGIFGMYFVMDELSRKIGLSYDVVKTNDLSDLGNATRPMTVTEKMKIQSYVNRGYDLFVKRCAEGRKMKDEDIRKIAEGRIWTGTQAKEIGLVDEIGDLNKAIQIAAKLGKVTNYRMVYYPEKKEFLAELMEEFSGNTKMKMTAAFLGEEYAPLLKLKTSKIQTGIMTRLDKFDIQ